MSAISIRKGTAWVVPGWVFRYLADAMYARLPETSRIRQRIETAIKDGSCWFSTEEMAEEDRTQFYKLVKEIHKDVSRMGASEFSTVEGYNGLKRRLAELVELGNPAL